MWSRYDWVTIVVAVRQVNTISCGIMTGFIVQLSIRQLNTICGRIMIGLIVVSPSVI